MCVCVLELDNERNFMFVAHQQELKDANGYEHGAYHSHIRQEFNCDVGFAFSSASFRLAFMLYTSSKCR